MLHFNKIHLNPINRDIILIVTLGFFIATLVVALGVMIASQI